MKKNILTATIIVASISFVIIGFFSYVKYFDNFRYSHEIDYAKELLLIPILKHEPTERWLNIVNGGLAKGNSKKLFYFFKIWFAQEGTTDKDIKNGILKLPAIKTDNKLAFDLFYKLDRPEIRCEIFNTKSEAKMAFSFPLNNCLYHPDLNGDGLWDDKDVQLAKTKHTKMIGSSITQ